MASTERQNVFSAIRVTNMVSIESQPQAVGEDLVIIKLKRVHLQQTPGTDDMGTSVTCDEPEAATKFMNLLHRCRSY